MIGEPITIFSCPKSWKDHINIIQRNALRSWTLLSPHIILFGNEEGTVEAAKEFGAMHVPDVKCSKFGTPLISDMFGRAEQMAAGRLMLFTNADMIYVQSMINGLHCVATELDRFLILGQRWDLDINAELDFEDGGRGLDLLVRTHGQKHSPSGMDYMGFPKHLWGPLPDFIIGRAAWDGALLSHTLHAKIPVVDATPYILAVHQNHDYSHLPGGWQEAWEGEEAQQNKDLAEPLPWIIDIWYSTHVLEPTGIVSKKNHVPPLPHRSVNDPGLSVRRPGTPIQQQFGQRPIKPPPVSPRPPEIRQAARPMITPEKSIPMTILACPKSFRPPFDLIQRNALGSWQKLFPPPEIILFGDEEGITKVVEEFGIIHIPDVERSSNGVPLINSIFTLAEKQGHGAILCYINADIVVTQSLMDVALRVRGQLDDFLMIGRRWGLDVSAPIPFTRGDWWRVLRRQVQALGNLGAPDALDYFIFTPDLWKEKLPPLAIGRAAMDGALIALALKADRPVVDATDVIFTVHQNHDYSHLPGGKNEAWNGPDAQRNRELVPDWVKTIAHATFKMTPGGLFRKA